MESMDNDNHGVSQNAGTDAMETEDIQDTANNTQIDYDSILKPAAHFDPISAEDMQISNDDIRKVFVPNHRQTPLRQKWQHLYTPLVDNLKLQTRYNPSNRCVEIKTSQYTRDVGALQKGIDFITAFILGFEIEDAIALIRLDDLYIESFDLLDVRQMLKGDDLQRAIGRIAGKDGRTKFALENTTMTRIVMSNRKIHILGSVARIRAARDAICDLIIGSPAGKVYGRVSNVASRMKERY